MMLRASSVYVQFARLGDDLAHLVHVDAADISKLFHVLNICTNELSR
jgi:hypothetical protein